MSVDVVKKGTGMVYKPALTLVFLPGLPLNRKMWEPQFADLENRYNLYAADYPGLGGTTPQEGLGLADYAEFVWNDLDNLLVEDVVLVGHSIGAQVALLLNERLGDRVKGVVLVDGHGTPVNEEEQGMYGGIAEALNAHGVAALTEDFKNLLLSPTTRSERPEVVQGFQSLMSEASVEGLATAFKALAGRPEPSSLLSQIQAPALLVYGAEDQATPPDVQGAALREGIPQAHWLEISGAGHIPSLETPGEFNIALHQFLSDLESERNVRST